MGGDQRPDPSPERLDLGLLVLLRMGIASGHQHRRGPEGPSPEPRSGRSHELSDVAVAGMAHGLGPGPPTDGPRKVYEVPSPRAKHLPGPIETAPHHVRDQTDDPLEHEQRHDPQQGREPVVLEEARQSGPLHEVTVAFGDGAVALAPVPGHPVQRHRSRRHQHPEPCEPDPPAEVEISLCAQSLVEEAGSAPCVPGHQDRRGRDVQDLPGGVVLALIDLPLLEGRVRIPEAVARVADLQKDTGSLRVEHLRPDQPDAGDAPGGLDHPGHGIGLQLDVVVHQQREVRLGRRRDRQSTLHRAGESLVPGQAHHSALAQDALEHLQGPVRRSVVDGQHAEARVRLARERRESAAKPSRGVMHHDHCEDAGGGVLHDRGHSIPWTVSGPQTKSERGAGWPPSRHGAPATACASWRSCTSLWFSFSKRPSSSPHSSSFESCACAWTSALWTSGPSSSDASWQLPSCPPETSLRSSASAWRPPSWRLPNASARWSCASASSYACASSSYAWLPCVTSFRTVRTPCASGVAALARSCLPTRRTARLDAARSSGTGSAPRTRRICASPRARNLPSRGRRSPGRIPGISLSPARGCSGASSAPPGRITFL